MGSYFTWRWWQWEGHSGGERWGLESVLHAEGGGVLGGNAGGTVYGGDAGAPGGGMEEAKAGGEALIHHGKVGSGIVKAPNIEELRGGEGDL